MPQAAALQSLKARGKWYETFTKGLDFDGFAGSALVRSAVERQFEIIGEALGKASKEDETLVRLIPEIPSIVGLRNRLIHGYDNVDDQLIWDVVRSKLPALRDALHRHVDSSGS